MAHYIRQEMSGKLSRDGKKKYYYRMKCYSNLGMDDVVGHIAECHGFSRGVTEGVIMALSDTIAEFLSKGHHVTVSGLGTFKVSLGEKNADTTAGNAGSSASSEEDMASDRPDVRRICVRDVLLAADADLTARVDSRITLEHGEDSQLKPSPYTAEERQERARTFLLRRPFMRVADYAALCGLSITTAQRELRAWAEKNTTIGSTATGASGAGGSTTGADIAVIGTGSHKVYVLSTLSLVAQKTPEIIPRC